MSTDDAQRSVWDLGHPGGAVNLMARWLLAGWTVRDVRFAFGKMRTLAALRVVRGGDA